MKMNRFNIEISRFFCEILNHDEFSLPILHDILTISVSNIIFQVMNYSRKHPTSLSHPYFNKATSTELNLFFIGSKGVLITCTLKNETDWKR